jgi:hypothetical protein
MPFLCFIINPSKGILIYGAPEAQALMPPKAYSLPRLERIDTSMKLNSKR